MANTTGVFDWEENSGGVSIVPARNFITNASLSEDELDGQITAAKADLDAAAKRAKSAIKARNKRTLDLQLVGDD